jgi:hypothetical protein
MKTVSTVNTHSSTRTHTGLVRKPTGSWQLREP